MIGLRVSARDRKTAIIGSIAVLSLLLIGRGAPAWYRWRSNAAASTGAVLGDASAATWSVSRSLEVDAEVRRAEVKRMEVSPAFVNGPGLAAAAANLASVVSDAATTHGLRLGALQASGDSTGVKSGGLVHLRVRGDATGDVTAVMGFLAALESGVPLIALREVSVTQAEPNASADKPESLHVEFALEALAHLASVEERP